MSLAKILSSEPYELPPDQIRRITTWLGDTGCDEVAYVVSHMVAEKKIAQINAEMNVDELPNYQEEINESKERITKLRNFLEVLAELRRMNSFKKITIKVDSL